MAAMAFSLRCLLLAVAAQVLVAAAPTIKHVMVISPDGMHAGDLTYFVSTNPKSNFAKIYNSAVSYPKAQAVAPTDSFPTLVGMLTGATPKTAGIYYETSFARELYPAGSNVSSSGPYPYGPPGAVTTWSESIESTDGTTLQGLPYNVSFLNLNKAGKPVFPWDYVQVNTLLNVVKANGGSTAWIDKQLGHSWVAGPGGQGLDDGFWPSQDFVANSKTQLAPAETYENYKIAALLCQMQGKYSNCSASPYGVPTFFGATFQIVNSFQKYINGGGYNGSITRPNNLTALAFQAMDGYLGQILTGLQQNNLADSTAIILCSKYGNAPIDPALLNKINPDFNAIFYNITGTYSEPAWVQADDVALVWLNNRFGAEAIAEALATQYAEVLGIDTVYYGESLAELGFYNPLTTYNDRVPDIIIKVKLGVIYTGSKTKYEEHGGFSINDRSVALAVYHPSIGYAHVNSKQISSRRVAPTVLSLLGFDPALLTSPEVPPPLPGLASFFDLYD